MACFAMSLAVFEKESFLCASWHALEHCARPSTEVSADPAEVFDAKTTVEKSPVQFVDRLCTEKKSMANFRVGCVLCWVSLQKSILNRHWTRRSLWLTSEWVVSVLCFNPEIYSEPTLYGEEVYGQLDPVFCLGSPSVLVFVYSLPNAIQGRLHFLSQAVLMLVCYLPHVTPSAPFRPV